MQLTVVTDRTDLLVLALAGRLDHLGASIAGTVLTARVNGSRRPTVLDLAELDFLASLGMGLLVASHRSVAGAGHRMVILRPKPEVENALRMARLDGLMPIVHDAAEAERVAIGG